MFPPVLANALTDWVSGVTEWLAEFSANWWFLLIILAVAYFDSVFPVVPSETMVIIGGVAAGQGEQLLAAVILAGALGAFLGDSSAYLIGSRMRGLVARRAERRPKWQERLDWARAQIRTRGGMLLFTARFIPGGRTALTISSGVTHQPLGWFLGWISVAVIAWASYGALLGYIGGQAFEDNHTLAFGVAFVAAISVSVLVEVIRWARNRNRAPEPEFDGTEQQTSH